MICIVADATGKYKLIPELDRKADLLVADSVAQTKERGEFEKAIAEGLIKTDSMVSLGYLIATNSLYRKEGDNRLILFDSSGVVLQDCAVSSSVVREFSAN